MKQLGGWAALAFVIWFVLAEPAAAAHTVHNIGTFLSGAARGLSTFITAI